MQQDPHLGSGPARRWDLRRNCSLTPRQSVASTGVLVAIVAAVTSALWIAGYPLVALFGIAEAAAISLALVAYARHARDGETITLHDGRLEIRRLNAHRVSVECFEACWVTVQRAQAPDAPIVLRLRQREMRLGAQLRPARRRMVERELRCALQSCGAGWMPPIAHPARSGSAG